MYNIWECGTLKWVMELIYSSEFVTRLHYLSEWGTLNYIDFSSNKKTTFHGIPRELILLGMNNSRYMSIKYLGSRVRFL